MVLRDSRSSSLFCYDVYYAVQYLEQVPDGSEGQPLQQPVLLWCILYLEQVPDSFNLRDSRSSSLFCCAAYILPGAGSRWF